MSDITFMEFYAYLQTIQHGTETEKCVAIGKLCAEEERIRLIVAGVILHYATAHSLGLSNEYINGLRNLALELFND